MAFNYSKWIIENDTDTVILRADLGDTTSGLTIHNPWVKFVICLFYFIVVICGIFGNGLVVFVVTRNKAMHTVTNFFIASLAVNDVIICALTVPLTPLYTFLEGWYFGSFMCHLFPLIQAASVYISTWTATTIAITRFWVICSPEPRKLSKAGALGSIVGIWLVALGLCSPYAIFVEFHPRDLLIDGGQQGLRCDETWNDNGRFTFSMLGLVLQYATPLVVIVYCYVAVCLKVRSQKTASKGEILLINLLIIGSN